MEGPRLTEERLRHHLDSNQVMRERMCLALLPLLGPFTREQPRRPRGGPDGGRDIEAVYQGRTTIWGAVGFRNGGGSDDEARNAMEKKFKEDLDRALEENASLAGFVFFTNVDLTPSRRESLVRYAHGKNVMIVDIFDMERLRHALDSPEGLIARLQYLEIPMSTTEQAALVGKFGSQLQHAVTTRFDRVEQTLAQMERFLQFQKPILRIDLYAELTEPTTSAAVGDEAILLRIGGLHDLPKTMCFLSVNQSSHSKAADPGLLTLTHIWNDESPSNILTLQPSVGPPNVLASYNELSLTTAGSRVRIADLTVVTFEACCTEGIRGKIKRIAVDANGYELVNHSPDGLGEVTTIKWPEALPYNAAGRKWQTLVTLKQRNFLFEPPNPSGRLLPLLRIPGA
jgi:hypothetical protein